MNESSPLLSAFETSRLDELLQANAVQNAPETQFLEASEHEQRIWMAHHQAPETTSWHTVSCIIEGKYEIARFCSAVQKLVEIIPDLTSRFVFDDEACLIKNHAEDWEDCVAVLTASSMSHAISTILSYEEKSWEPENTSPFKALFIQQGDVLITALLVHPVVSQTWTPHILLEYIAKAYNGITPVPLPPRTIPLQAFQTDRTAPLDWACKSNLEAVDLQILNGTIGGTDGSLSAFSGKVTQCHLAEVAVDALPEAQAGSEDKVFASLSAKFAHFVCEAGNHDRILLKLSQEPSSGGHSSACINRISSVAEAAQSVLACMERSDHSSASGENENSDDPAVTISKFSPPPQFGTFPETKTIPLFLPTFEQRPDLELTAGKNIDGNILLNLTTGQNISSLAGGFILEKFIGFILGQPAPALNASSATACETNDDLPVETGSEAITDLILDEFRQALSEPDMGPDDDFFDYGGHSLVATRIIGRLLEKHGIEIHFNELFSHPTASGLALKATQHSTKDPETHPTGSLSPEQEPGMFPLSLAQMSLWKAYAAFGFGDIFNIPFALRFIDKVDERIFERAFTDVVERHTGLRTLFKNTDSSPQQQVLEVDALENFKWFWNSEECRNVTLAEEAGHIFNLETELPFRLRFLQDEETGEQVLSFLFHHIALDEWSVNLMMDELAQAYAARQNGDAPEWTELCRPFHEFAVQQTAHGVDRQHVSYWTDRLEGAPESFHAKEASDTSSTDSSVAGGWTEIRLDSSTSSGLYNTSRQYNASLFNVAYAAILVALHRFNGACDIVIGTSASGRTDPAFFDTIGYFTTVVAHRLKFENDTKFSSLITLSQDAVNNSMPYTDIPIDLVEESLGMTPGKDHLFDVFIQIHAHNKLNGTLNGPDGTKIAFRQIDPDKHESMLGLQFEIMEEMIDNERSIRVLISYRNDLYSPEQVETLCNETQKAFSEYAALESGDRSLAHV